MGESHSRSLLISHQHIRRGDEEKHDCFALYCRHYGTINTHSKTVILLFLLQTTMMGWKQTGSFR
jgi:hypothetical protein